MESVSNFSLVKKRPAHLARQISTKVLLWSQLLSTSQDVKVEEIDVPPPFYWSNICKASYFRIVRIMIYEALASLTFFWIVLKHS